jgi:hypothetical protein
VCPPCYWVELGAQLRVYQFVVAALERKRSRIERRIGATACRRAERHRRSLLARNHVVAGFGNVLVRTEASAAGVPPDRSSRPSGEAHAAG